MRGGVDQPGAGCEDVHHSVDDVLEAPVVGVEDQLGLLSESREGSVGLLISTGVVDQNVQSLVTLSVIICYCKSQAFRPT